MSNQKYDAIWVKGSFFEKGHWKFVPRTGDSGIGAIIMLFFVIFLICIVVLISPLIIALIGFSIIKPKRYYASIVSILALIYLLIDFKKKWITAFIIFGSNNNEGVFSDGLLGIKFAPHFFFINSVALGLSIYFLLSSYFVVKNNSRIHLNSIENNKNIISIIIGITIGLLSFFYLKNTYSTSEIQVNNTILNSTEIPEESDDNYEIYSDTSSSYISNDTIQSTNVIVEKYEIGQELNGGIIFQLNEDQTHGLVYFNSDVVMNFEEANKWCLNNNYRLPTIDELTNILNMFPVSKEELNYWSSELASNEDKSKYNIICRTTKVDGNEVSLEDSEFIKCYDYYYKKIRLIQNNYCSESKNCNTLGIISF